MSTALAPTTRTIDGQELPPAGTYDLDVSHSTVGFFVKHLMSWMTRHPKSTSPRSNENFAEVGAA